MPAISHCNKCKTSLQGANPSSIISLLAIRRKEDSNHITDWMEEILDASMGYKKAHNWTRPNSKAPPLPTHMWKKGKYVSHPHEMGDILLKQWGNGWTQGMGKEMAEEMWGKIRQQSANSSYRVEPMQGIWTKSQRRM